MLYYDFTSSLSIINGEVKYSGGTNYAIAVIKDILKLHMNKVIVVLPVGTSTEEKDKLGIGHCTSVYVNSLLSLKCESGSKLFIPQVNGRTLLLIPQIKKRNPTIKIYATLHDKQHNFYKFDWYDRYYSMGIHRLGITAFVQYYIKRIAFILNYQRCVKKIDEVITDSNFSMQKLMVPGINSINFFLQKSWFHDVKKVVSRGDYILFVSGGRPEKNLLRTLEAFSKFKQEKDSKTKFIVTGINDTVKKALYSSGKFDNLTEGVDYEMLGYVSGDELAGLYAGARYVAFTSKGEGYGLPVREAMAYGKVVLASRTTSVPEVAGAVMCYVDPFNVESIKKGMSYLDQDEILDEYEKFIIPKLEYIEAMAELDNQILVERLIR